MRRSALITTTVIALGSPRGRATNIHGPFPSNPHEGLVHPASLTADIEE